MSAVVAVGPPAFAARLGGPRPPARRSGSASPSLYQLARGLADRNPAKAFANGYARRRPRDARHAPALRADAPAIRRPAPPARDGRLVDVLELGVHGRRAGACSGSTSAGTTQFVRFRNSILLANVIGLVGYVVHADRAAAAARRSASSTTHQRRPRQPRREPVRGDAEPARRRRADRRRRALHASAAAGGRRRSGRLAGLGLVLRDGDRQPLLARLLAGIGVALLAMAVVYSGPHSPRRLPLVGRNRPPADASRRARRSDAAYGHAA